MTRILFQQKREFNATNSKELSKKLKMFFQLCTEFLEYLFNFEHCKKKNEPYSLCISEVIDGEKRGYVNV